MSLLSLFVLIPFAGSLGIVLFSLLFKGALPRFFAFLISLLPLSMLLFLKSELFSSATEFSWASALDIYFSLKIDALSYLFLLTTALIIPIVVLAAKEKEALFFALLLLFETFLFLFFTVQDLALFTLFWEASLLPVYFMMVFWGSEISKKAAMKFIIYMISGSFLLVAAVLALYFSSHSFNLTILAKTADTLPYAPLLFAVFALAFAVKTPMFPFHGWLSDAYTESPLSATILLSSLLSKLGIYGFFRIGFSLFPLLMEKATPYFLPLAIFGVIYGAFAAWMQTDYKRLIAYSSFSHVNFILAGIFTAGQVAHQGALLQVLNHALIITGLFLAAHFLEEKIHTRSLVKHRGLCVAMPNLCWLTLLFMLASVALPGTNSFIGELLILFGVFKEQPVQAAFLALSVILSVIYMLRYMELNFFGKELPLQNGFSDIGKREISLLVPLIALIFLIGIYPNILLKSLEFIK